MDTVPLNIVTEGEHASHLDHAMTPTQRRYALAAVREGRATCLVGEFGPAFYIASVKLPAHGSCGPTVPCALRGPSVGDPPIGDADTFRACRVANGQPRPNGSRMVRLPMGASDTLTAIVIGGNLATMYGGPLAPREPDDPDIPENELEASREFWAEHALSADGFELSDGGPLD